jgi:hypothetical protein
VIRISGPFNAHEVGTPWVIVLLNASLRPAGAAYFIKDNGLSE